jgi:23S rRNA pseudouridine1911/1915/1917 synthase
MPSPKSKVFHVTDNSSHTLAARLRAWIPGSSWSQVRRMIHGRRVMLNGNVCQEEARRLKSGDVVKLLEQAAQKPPQEHDVEIVYLDTHVCVVVKPAGINSNRHEDEQFSRRRQFQPSLAELLPRVLRKREKHSGGSPAATRIIPVHRLDRETAGLIVYARNAKAERALSLQFREHTVHRRYLAIIPGYLEAQTIESRLVRDRGDGRRGSSSDDRSGRIAITHIRPVEPLEGYTVIECRLETGRTHQIRIHLSELGHPLCGEKVYNRPLGGKPIRDKSRAPRLALHAAELGFVHPATGRQMRFNCPWPRDLAQFLEQLRSRSHRASASDDSEQRETDEPNSS